MNKPSDNKTLICSFRYEAVSLRFFFSLSASLSLPLKRLQLGIIVEWEKTKKDKSKRREWEEEEEAKTEQKWHDRCIISILWIQEIEMKGKTQRKNTVFFSSLLSTFYSDKWFKLELKTKKTNVKWKKAATTMFGLLILSHFMFR